MISLVSSVSSLVIKARGRRPGIRGFSPGPCRRGGARRRRTHRPPLAPEIRTASGSSAAVSPPDSIHGTRHAMPGDQPPVEREAVAARQRVGRGAAAWRRTAAYRRSLRSSEAAEHVMRRRRSAIAFITGRPKRALASATRSGLSPSVELQDIERRRFERRRDRGVVGVDKQPDPPHRRRHLGAQRGGARRRHAARARRVEDKAEIRRAALDRRGDRVLARQPADFGGDAHKRDMVLRRQQAREAAELYIPR